MRKVEGDIKFCTKLFSKVCGKTNSLAFFSFLLTTRGLWDILNTEKSLKEKFMKEFFKDVFNWFKDMPDLFRFLLVGLLVICTLFVFRHMVKMFYNKDKIKLAFLPIIGLSIMVAAIVLLCVTA